MTSTKKVARVMLNTKKNFLKYLFLTTGIFAFLVSIALYCSQPLSWFDIPIIFLMYGTSIWVAEIFLQKLVDKTVLIPQLKTLSSNPRVAILYFTCDDVVEKCISKLKNQTYHCDIFVLDDSTQPELIKIVDKYGYHTIRRSTRTYNKSGALYEWLEKYGRSYDYFVTYDADSEMPPNSIYDLLLFAETPENSDIVIFQTSLHCSKAKTSITKIFGLLQNIDSVCWAKTRTYVGNAIWFGHNALCRTAPFLQIDVRKNFISEDFAISCELIEQGYRIVTVPIVTYEGIPNNLQSYLKRSMRWFNGGHESLKLMTKNLPFSVNYFLWTNIYYHITLITMPIFILVFVFDKSFIYSFQLSVIFWVWFWLLSFLVPNFYNRKVRAKWRTSLVVEGIFVTTAVYLVMSLYEWKAFVLWLLRKKPQFTITPKIELTILKNSSKYLIPLVLFLFILGCGIVSYNQNAILYGISWFPIMLLSPVTLYFADR